MPRVSKKDEQTITFSSVITCPVKITDNLFSVENPLLATVLKNVTKSESPRVIIVADMNVVQRTEGLGVNIGKYIKEYGIQLVAAPVIINSSEKNKNDNGQTAQRIIASAIDAKVGVNDVMLILGGGALLDVANYAAAHVRGGLKVVRIPTTTAAMFDSAFATFAALNLPKVKDAIRIASLPSAILIDPAFASTILDGVWRGGIVEAVRYALMFDGSLMKKIAKNAVELSAKDSAHTKNIALLKELLIDVVAGRIKKGTTSLGLWSSHRFQSMSAYHLPHGYAVPLGILLDCDYALARGLIDEATWNFVVQTLLDIGAVEGISHSRAVFTRDEEVLAGLDSWYLATGSKALAFPAGIGKHIIEEEPDRELYRNVLLEFNKKHP